MPTKRDRPTEVPPKTMPTNPHRDDCDDANFDVDEASDESFPASDPPSYTGSIASAEEAEDDEEEEE